jgi:glucose/arabinose dehydrogenase
MAHTRTPWWISFAVACLALAPPEPAVAQLALSLELFAQGLTRPTDLANAGDTRLFATEQAGVIRIIESDGTVRATPFLDITGRVDSSSNEEGLLGLAFHPNYASNGYFYVNYVNTTGGTRRSRISRFSVTGDPNIADAATEVILLTVIQPNANHNGGALAFGPSGYLYIALGDGGGSGDPGDNGQDPTNLLGTIARIDVDAGPGNAPDCVDQGAGGYTVPASNPLSDGAGGDCDEIWATGLRNPWRISFDRVTGDLLIADVGQNTWEEIDFQPAASAGGENYGWRCYEGNASFNTAGCAAASAYDFPIFVYDHDDGCSVTGGYVYRGPSSPALYGRYVLADYCSGTFWDLKRSGPSWNDTPHPNLAAFGVSSFGENAVGELFVANRSEGRVYRLRGPASEVPLSVPLALGFAALVVWTGFRAAARSGR